MVDIFIIQIHVIDLTDSNPTVALTLKTCYFLTMNTEIDNIELIIPDGTRNNINYV